MSSLRTSVKTDKKHPVDDQSDKKDYDNSISKILSQLNDVKKLQVKINQSPDKIHQNKLRNISKIISMLSIENNVKIGILTIRISQKSLSEKQDSIQAVINHIKNEFQQFKLSYKNQFIPINDFIMTANNNELVIGIPPLYYEHFIQQLVDNNLLPKRYKKIPSEVKPTEHNTLPEVIDDTGVASVKMDEADELLNCPLLATRSKPNEWC